MKDYNRTLLTKDQFTSLTLPLLQSFREFKPRSEFIRKSKSITQHNIESLDVTEQPNLLSFQTIHAPNQLENVLSFDNVFKDTEVFDLLKSKFCSIDRYVSEHVISVKNSFITFSTNITGAQIGVKHVHSLLNGDCCNVWSFALPLWIDSSNSNHANFWYNSNESLFPSRYYVDYERIKKLNIEYTGFRLPKDGKVLSIMFDGSRTPHYIDYTSHFYAFLVFDGIVLKESIVLGKKFITELL